MGHQLEPCGRDFFAANDADPEFTFVYPLECRLNCANFGQADIAEALQYLIAFAFGGPFFKIGGYRLNEFGFYSGQSPLKFR